MKKRIAILFAISVALLNIDAKSQEPVRAKDRPKAVPARALAIEKKFDVVFYKAGITYTMGGVAIDGGARVRHRDGGVVAGLYAAGSVTGGHEGGPGVGYTGGLMKALAFGLLAGETIGKARCAI